MGVTVQIVFDAADPEALAQFWASAAGYVIQPPPEGFESWQAFLAQIGVPEDQWDKASACVDPDGHGPRFFFQKVPEPKAVKNRVHVDLQPGACWPRSGRAACGRAGPRGAAPRARRPDTSGIPRARRVLDRSRGPRGQRVLRVLSARVGAVAPVRHWLLSQPHRLALSRRCRLALSRWCRLARSHGCR